MTCRCSGTGSGRDGTVTTAMPFPPSSMKRRDGGAREAMAAERGVGSGREPSRTTAVCSLYSPERGSRVREVSWRRREGRRGAREAVRPGPASGGPGAGDEEVGETAALGRTDPGDGAKGRERGSRRSPSGSRATATSTWRAAWDLARNGRAEGGNARPLRVVVAGDARVLRQAAARGSPARARAWRTARGCGLLEGKTRESGWRH